MLFVRCLTHHDFYFKIRTKRNIYRFIKNSVEMRIVMNDTNQTQNTKDLENDKAIIHDLTTGNNYQNSSDKYQDNLSSSITFFVCGIVGLIVMILNIIGVLHFFSIKTPSGILICTVLSALFIAFLVIGSITYKSASKAKSQIETEQKINNEVSLWLKDNLTKEHIDTSFDGDGMSEEMKYFDRNNCIVAAIKEQYPELNEDIVQSIADEYIQFLYK